ncbi:threonine/serine exporter family protein [Robertkochia solimangrovi]|uniref:threonine/serine exporter family protein n=1 Tax=Robertkochia solimangrovi TaxID=2213046 RepID=UPI00117F2344|nr:threonine/serine exporter family protein [Robertkochia solimangrovi]TRZ42145.1 threonine/serine exporter [Robertkochia solimangrovi]
MSEFLYIILKSIPGGFAAVGFAILFNVPKRTLLSIFSLGFMVIFIRNTAMQIFEVNIILSSLIASVVVGFSGVYISHWRKAPPLVFSIPAVIPAIPGIFLYRFMIGVITLSKGIDYDHETILYETMNNGLKAFFIVCGLAVGVIFPNLIFRKQSFKRRRNIIED